MCNLRSRGERRFESGWTRRGEVQEVRIVLRTLEGEVNKGGWWLRITQGRCGSLALSPTALSFTRSSQTSSAYKEEAHEQVPSTFPPDATQRDFCLCDI